jgi:hypothetical protein
MKSHLVAAAGLCCFTGFQEDLRGDTVVAVPLPTGTVIEDYGSTSLIQVENNFLLQPASGAPVKLSYHGAPVVDGEFSDSRGHWKPIAAEQTGTGFEVAWKAASADRYSVWCTDALGEYLFSALTDVSGTSPALELFEPNFHQDLNSDGVVGAKTSDLGDQPRFAYKGADSSGAQLYEVNWQTRGWRPFAVRVLAPARPSPLYQHSFLFDLPVQPGLAQSTWGSGLDELAKLDVEDQYNTTIVEPIFPMDSWYADNPDNPTIDYETFVASSLHRWVETSFSPIEDEKTLLIGLSKSGYGAMDLLLKHPDTFDAVAAFDIPADMASYAEFGSSSSRNYGTEDNFQLNYKLGYVLAHSSHEQFRKNNRILASVGPVFTAQMANLDTTLTLYGVAHTMLYQTNHAHNWSSGWLPDAVAGLFKLETNLNEGAATGSEARRSSKPLKSCPASL